MRKEVVGDGAGGEGEVSGGACSARFASSPVFGAAVASVATEVSDSRREGVGQVIRGLLGRTSAASSAMENSSRSSAIDKPSRERLRRAGRGSRALEHASGPGGL